MSIEHWLAFALASAILVAIPGPTVLLVISYALGHGRKSATATVAGVALGDFTAMTASMLGLGAFLAASATLFTALKLIGAAVLRPYVSPDNHWLIQHHAVFQGYYYYHHIGMDRDERERYRGHPMFERTAAFCEKWDQCSFDPDYDTMPFSAFEPMLRRLFARRPFVYGS